MVDEQMTTTKCGTVGDSHLEQQEPRRRCMKDPLGARATLQWGGDCWLKCQVIGDLSRGLVPQQIAVCRAQSVRNGGDWQGGQTQAWRFRGKSTMSWQGLRDPLGLLWGPGAMSLGHREGQGEAARLGSRNPIPLFNKAALATDLPISFCVNKES